MIKVGIIGATGYAGNELVRLLLGHKDAEIVWLGSRSYIDQNYSDVYRNMFKLVDAKCMDDNMEQLANEVDVIFTATPQGLCASLVNDEILSKTKIIDLSADFRLKDVNVYEQWYKLEHKAPQYIDEAVYGLCEINRDKVSKDTRIIANPGCYTTTSILTLYPMVKEGIINPDTIIIDAKSGTSGAGRGAKVANLFCEVNESMKAYGVGTHRHTPEIEEQLGYACGRDDLKLIFAVAHARRRDRQADRRLQGLGTESHRILGRQRKRTAARQATLPQRSGDRERDGIYLLPRRRRLGQGTEQPRTMGILTAFSTSRAQSRTPSEPCRDEKTKNEIQQFES